MGENIEDIDLLVGDTVPSDDNDDDDNEAQSVEGAVQPVVFTTGDLSDPNVFVTEYYEVVDDFFDTAEGLGRQIQGFGDQLRFFCEPILVEIHKKIDEIQSVVERVESSGLELRSAVRTISGLTKGFRYLVSLIQSNIDHESGRNVRKVSICVLSKIPVLDVEMLKEFSELVNKAYPSYMVGTMNCIAAVFAEKTLQGFQISFEHASRLAREKIESGMSFFGDVGCIDKQSHQRAGKSIVDPTPDEVSFYISRVCGGGISLVRDDKMGDVFHLKMNRRIIAVEINKLKKDLAERERVRKEREQNQDRGIYAHEYAYVPDIPAGRKTDPSIELMNKTMTIVPPGSPSCPCDHVALATSYPDKVLVTAPIYDRDRFFLVPKDRLQEIPDPRKRSVARRSTEAPGLKQVKTFSKPSKKSMEDGLGESYKKRVPAKEDVPITEDEIDALIKWSEQSQ